MTSSNVIELFSSSREKRSASVSVREFDPVNAASRIMERIAFIAILSQPSDDRTLNGEMGRLALERSIQSEMPTEAEPA